MKMIDVKDYKIQTQAEKLEQELEALRIRNEIRVKSQIENMGEKWVLHKANSPKQMNGRGF